MKYEKIGHPASWRPVVLILSPQQQMSRELSEKAGITGVCFINVYMFGDSKARL